MSDLEPVTFRVTRADLAAYAEVSGDHNPIHQDEAIAVSVGLPDVIAHGMYTLALAARAVDGWVGRPGTIRELGAKFTKPVIVPAGEQGAEVTVSGTREGDRFTLVVTSGETKVLGNPVVVVAS